MAYDKVVDSAKLDADLTMVADAIRARAGTSEPLAFPEGMKDALEGIQDESASVLNALIDRSIAEVVNNDVITIGKNTFSECKNLKKAHFAEVTTVEGTAFSYCDALEDVSLPKAKVIRSNAFAKCTALKKLDLPSIGFLNDGVVNDCSNFNVLILRGTSVVSMASTKAFMGTPFASGGTGGTVYCPSAQIQNYQTATNWSTLYAAGTCNFVAIEGSEYE